ncbi:MAG TPA: hypothetical protein VLK24_12645, partial [Gaiellaceae bacterium]|nr:hypothetical protein [Gaiellaceae bacterium]
MLKALALSGFAVLFSAGALLAGIVATGGHAADTTTTEQTTITETSPGETTTVEQTTTRRVIVPTTTGTTTSGSETGSDIPDWVWVVIGLLALGLIVLLVVLLTRRGGGAAAVPADERQRRLDNAVGSWTMQGWALDNQTADSAVLRRGNELMQISIDSAGQITTRPL